MDAALATAMLWGAIGGACIAGAFVFWFWDMKPSKAETEWLRSEVKDLRRDLNEECAKRQRVADRVLAIEKPPFNPKFGDMVMAERVDKSGMWPTVYLFTRDKLHRVVAHKEGGEVVEYFTDTIGPFND